MASVNSRTSMPSGAWSWKMWKSASFAPQKRIRSGVRTMTVQSSTIFPLSSVSGPYAICPWPSFETSRATIVFT